MGGVSRTVAAVGACDYGYTKPVWILRGSLALLCLRSGGAKNPMPARVENTGVALVAMHGQAAMVAERLGSVSF